MVIQNVHPQKKWCWVLLASSATLAKKLWLRPTKICWLKPLTKLTEIKTKKTEEGHLDMLFIFLYKVPYIGCHFRYVAFNCVSECHSIYRFYIGSIGSWDVCFLDLGRVYLECETETPFQDENGVTLKNPKFVHLLIFSWYLSFWCVKISDNYTWIKILDFSVDLLQMEKTHNL